MFEYRIYCKVYPRSGFELQQSNKIIAELGDSINLDGCVLKTFVFRSMLTVSLRKAVSIIKHEYPEAEIIYAEELI